MPQPLIGLTTHPWDAPDHPSLDRLLDAIVQAVERAGGLPLLLPPALADATLRGIFERLGVDPARDHLELTLARWTVDERKPVFGICRGLQTLNVALGGALYGDISEHPDAQRHTYYPGLPFDLRAHSVDIAADSLLARIIGEPRVMVNSLHHQAARVVARAEDALVEALEAPGHPFALAVQWRPEALPDVPGCSACSAPSLTPAARRGERVDSRRSPRITCGVPRCYNTGLLARASRSDRRLSC